MLKAGLITEKQAKQADHQERQKTRKKGVKGREQERKSRADEAKSQIEAQRLADLERAKQENARREAEEARRQESQKRQSTLDSVFKDGQLTHWSGNTRYYYLNGKVVDFLLVKDDVARKLEHGQAAIAMSIYGHAVPVLLNAAAAKTLRDIAPEQLLTFHTEE